MIKGKLSNFIFPDQDKEAVFLNLYAGTGTSPGIYRAHRAECIDLVGVLE